uniref:Galectin n=1 Tax=Panagrellus redivivus TaxID=6233 RepID=A0A7E4V556_PANRE
MKWLEASLLEVLFFAVLLTASVNAEAVDRLDDHICPGPAYVVSNNTNAWTFIKERSGPLTPAMRYVRDIWAYGYWHQFAVGQTLYFRGKIKRFRRFFQVNILAGTAVDMEGAGQTLLRIQFGFRPDNLLGFINLSTKKDGQWSTVSIDNSPLSYFEPFDISIYGMQDRFQIRVNKKFSVDYTNVLGLNYAYLYQNAQDVDLDRVFIGGQIFDMPFSVPLPDGRFNFADTIILQAVATNDFSINLVDKGGIPMAFYPRYKEKYVSRNALMNGKWGEHEKNGTFPFTAGDEFELVITNTPSYFEFYVNNKLFATFAHRITTPEEYTTFDIAGDISPRHLSLCKSKV